MTETEDEAAGGTASIEDYPAPPAAIEPEPEPEPEATMPEKTQETRTIRLVFDPAIESRGKYLRGVEYTVPADEAEYLLSTGHFEEVIHVAG